MAGSATAADQNGRRDELLVGVAPSTAGVRRTAERALPAEARIVNENARLGYVTVELPARASGTAKAAVASAITSQQGVEYVEQNTVHEALYVPNDPRFDEQYVPQMVNAPAAWDTTLGERAVTVAIVDAGVKYDHPDLDGNFGNDVGRDFVDGDDDPYPDVLGEEHHGTHVAGIVAAETDNGEGIAGISDSTLLSVRALDESGRGYTSDIADGIQWATDEGADVINLSFGGGGYTETMKRAVSYADEKDVVVVAAAGNDYGGPVAYPAAYEECIAVSALDSDGTLAGYSNVGPEVELCAPGTSVLSTWPDDGYRTLSGTSMAAPVVSGVVALVRSREDLTTEAVRTRLKNTAVDMGLSSKKQGAGRVDAAAAVGTQHAILTIEGVDDAVRYEFSVTGSVVENSGVEQQWADRIDGTTASGVVGRGEDSYAFSGELARLDVDGQAIVHLNGERIDPADYPDNNILTIEGDNDTVRYEFAATGSVGENSGVEQQWADRIDGTTASGVVGRGRDSYTFSGELVRLDVDGQAKVNLNGKRINPADYPDSVLTIEGVNDTVRYEFAATGNVVENSGVEQQWADRIDGTTASGVVGRGKDSYAFSGELVRLDVDGQAKVNLNGERIDPADYPDNILTIEGMNGTVRYDFSVTGSIEENNGVEQQWADRIEGTTASGVVGRGQDSYTFSGELLTLDVDGEAIVLLNGKRIGSTESPILGIYSGLSDTDFDTIDHIEEWQDTPYAVQNLFVPWNPDEGHMNWLFDRTLPKIWANGRVPLITWEPFTPGPRTASVDTQSLVERDEYLVYLQGLAETTPDDIEVRIGNGEYDSYIDTWASRLKGWLAGPDGQLGTADDRQAYIRLGHEMNGDWYPWSPTVGTSSPESYIEMWRRVRSRFEQRGVGADSIQWMWCANADDVGEYSAEQLYPGDAYVDWLSIDGYQWGDSANWSHWESPESILSDMLGRVRAIADKPVCIAETASTSETEWGHDPERKDEWIQNAFDYFADEEIDMWCWFNESKETDWAMFDGARGTETVAVDGEQVNAYAAYRNGVEAYSSTASATKSKPMTAGAFTNER